MLRRAASATVAAAAAASAAGPAGWVWPVPQEMSASGAPLAVSPSFRFDVRGTSVVLSRAAARYERYIAANATGGEAAALAACRVEAASYDEALRRNTSSAYTLRVGGGACAIAADTVYGAAYGMETLYQLAAGGRLPNGTVAVRDAAAFPHRGVMVDAGRRFWPVPLLENVVDTMSFGKLNVLHLHASDMCRFGVESRLFPELTANLTGVKEGFYSRADIAHLVAYARDRGVVVVPELDMPGHAAGYIPLEARGVEFCNKPGESGIPNWCTVKVGDNTSAAWSVLPRLVAEMQDLFGGDTYHAGGDEVAGDCSHGVAEFEALLRAGLEARGVTTMGWGGNMAVTQSWGSPNASQLATGGRFAVESAPKRFYLSSGRSTPGVTGAWCDLGPVPAQNRSFLLGGEVALWTDQWCYINDCVRPNAAKPAGHLLFDRSNDAAFARSVSGMLWPRGHLAAGSFWNFRGDLPRDEVAARATARHNSLAAQRGGMVCPTGCSCGVTSACGEPYLPSTPPPPPGPPPPVAPTPAPGPPGRCAFSNNTGMSGGDLGRHRAQSEEECCQLCIANAGCKAADFATDGTCHLKRAYSPVPRNDGSVGVRLPSRE